MIPEVIEKGMLDFGRLYKYNLIWKFWGKITFAARGSENNEISPGTSWWWCPEDVREHYGRLRPGFLFIRAPAQQATPPDQRFFTPEKSGWESREIQFKVEGNTFLDICILKVQQVFNWGSLWLMVWQQAQLSKSCMPAAREASFKPTQLLRAAVGYTEACDDNVPRCKLS